MLKLMPLFTLRNCHMGDRIMGDDPWVGGNRWQFALTLSTAEKPNHREHRGTRRNATERMLRDQFSVFPQEVGMTSSQLLEYWRGTIHLDRVIPKGRLSAHKRDRTMPMRGQQRRVWDYNRHVHARAILTTLLMIHRLRKVPLSCAFRAGIRDDNVLVSW